MKNEKLLTKESTDLVLCEEKRDLPDHTLKIYNLYRIDKLKKKSVSGKMISAQNRPEAPIMLREMAKSLGLTPSEKEIDALANEEEGLYIWDDGGACAIARIAFVGEKYARINTVYTAPEKRGHGYAGALVSSLAEMLIEKGLVPTVLADEENPVSNTLYLSLGFVPDGKICEYSKKGVKHSENAIFYVR